MNNDEVLQTAMLQSAIDANCCVQDFCKTENVIVYSKKNSNARRYLELPFACNLISYGSNIVASIDEKYEKIVRAYIEKYPIEHCFETPNMYVLNDAFLPYDLEVCFMAEYFLPDMTKLSKETCLYDMKILTKEDFTSLYVPEWSMRFVKKEKS